jgi:sialidase-1
MMKKIYTLLLCASFSFITHAEFSNDSSAIFIGGTDGYHTYRIPAIISAPDGTLLAFCEGRKSSNVDSGDIDLLLKRSSDNGTTWSPQVVIQEEGGEAPITIGNPCPVVDASTGTIWLSYTRNNARVFVLSSADNGLTWSTAHEITEDLKAFPFKWTRAGTGPGNGIQSSSGRLIMPIWLNDKIGQQYRSAIIYSDDAGKTWQTGGMVPATFPGANECMVAELNPDTLYMNFRTKDSAKRRGESWSTDDGLTWSSPMLNKALLDPICQASILTTSTPGFLIFANPASAKRERLAFKVSTDTGRTWTEDKVLWPGAAAYSCMLELPNNTIGCIFEAGEHSPYESIRFVRFPIMD